MTTPISRTSAAAYAFEGDIESINRDMQRLPAATRARIVHNDDWAVALENEGLTRG